MSFQDFELVPPDDDEIDPQDDIDAAAATALGDPFPDEGDDPPAPYGRSWFFDFEADPPRFVHRGHAPAETQGLETLKQWCLMAVHSARFAHPVFSDRFGMELPEGGIGELGSAEVVADFQARIRDALLVHDRVAEVIDFKGAYDPTVGVLTISGFTVVTDEADALNVGPVTLAVGT